MKREDKIGEGIVMTPLTITVILIVLMCSMITRVGYLSKKPRFTGVTQFGRVFLLHGKSWRFESVHLY